MTHMQWKYLFAIFIVLTTAVCCKKKTLSGGPVISPGTVDSVPVSKPDPVYVQTAIHTSIDANIGGFYQALPPSYDSNTELHPLIVFLHGGGERGNGDNELPLVLSNAIPKLLDTKSFPLSFTADGHQYSFIIISPQFKEWPKPEDVEAVVDYSIDHYRVDTHRIYMVGLSMGGGATWEYASRYGKRLAAMVPISGASWADSATAKGISATNLHTWAFHNIDDSTVTYKSTTRYVNFIQYYNPSFPVKVTLWPIGGHDAWTKATDPSYTEDGKNIYEWMLQYVR